MQRIEYRARARVDTAEALRYLGYKGQELAPGMADRIGGAVAACEDASRPAWCYRIFPAVCSGGVLELEGTSLALSLGRTLEPFRHASYCAVLACTLGLGFEREALRLGATDAVAALIYDAAGSSMVEAAADDCERALGERAEAMGLFACQRLSPGYGDIPLSASDDILRILEAGVRLGISATESHMLVPTKSVTALVGFFESDEQARRLRYSCAGCAALASCPYLKDGAPCYL